MTKAEDLCTTLKTKMKVLDKREGQLRYQRAKARREIGVEKGCEHFEMGCGA
jgi:hypothetical protein